MFYVLDACLNCFFVDSSYEVANEWAITDAEERNISFLYVTYYDDEEAKLLGIYPDHPPGERHDQSI